MALNQFPLEGTTFRLSLVIAGLLFVVCLSLSISVGSARYNTA